MIKKFNEFNESLNQEDLNYILDKISKKGINSISDVEKKELDNFSNPNYNFREELINSIKLVVDKYDQSLTMGEMEASSSPAYKQIDQEIHLIERLYSDNVEVVVYGGYKYNDVINEYDVDYNELDNSILIEIKEIVDNAVEYGFIGKNLR